MEFKIKIPTNPWINIGIGFFIATALFWTFHLATPEFSLSTLSQPVFFFLSGLAILIPSGELYMRRAAVSTYFLSSAAGLCIMLFSGWWGIVLVTRQLRLIP